MSRRMPVRADLRNLRIERGLPLSRVSRADVERATEWHWGTPPKQVVAWDEHPYPKRTMPEIGRLVELQVRPFGPKGNPLQRKEVAPLPASAVEQSHVAFLPGAERIYLFTPPTVRRMCLAGWNRSAAMPLRAAAKAAGGSQQGGYPDLAVTPLGVFSDIVYLTHKKSDGLSQYIHAFGEVSGVHPWLCVDSIGRLWLAGGNYTTPVEGITD